jgi:hypothetical protein
MGGGTSIALPWRFYLRGLVVTGVLGIGLWFLRPYIDLGTGARLGVLAGCYAVAYVFVGRISGVLTSSDVQTLRRWLTFGVWK